MKKPTRQKLTKHQRLVLAAATGRDHLAIEPLPDELGTAGPKTVAALRAAGLLIKGKTGPMISMAGFDALGAEPTAYQLAILDQSRAGSASGDREGSRRPKQPAGKRARRSNGKQPPKAASDDAAAETGTKQARLVAMLSRPAGATIAQLAQALGWQPHTVRGVIAGVAKKKLGLAVTSEKNATGPRVYRIR
jgi:hypothetical protein